MNANLPDQKKKKNFDDPIKGHFGLTKRTLQIWSLILVFQDGPKNSITCVLMRCRQLETWLQKKKKQRWSWKPRLGGSMSQRYTRPPCARRGKEARHRLWEGPALLWRDIAPWDQRRTSDLWYDKRANLGHLKPPTWSSSYSVKRRWTGIVGGRNWFSLIEAVEVVWCWEWDGGKPLASNLSPEPLLSIC